MLYPLIRAKSLIILARMRMYAADPEIHTDVKLKSYNPITFRLLLDILSYLEFV